MTEYMMEVMADIEDCFPVEGYDETDWLKEYEYAEYMWNEYTDKDINFVLSVIRTCQGYSEKQIQNFIKEKYFPCEHRVGIKEENDGNGITYLTTVLCESNVWCFDYEYCGNCMNEELFG